jgi:hypothetical protein
MTGDQETLSVGSGASGLVTTLRLFLPFPQLNFPEGAKCHRIIMIITISLSLATAFTCAIPWFSVYSHTDLGHHHYYLRLA